MSTSRCTATIPMLSEMVVRAAKDPEILALAKEVGLPGSTSSGCAARGTSY